VWYERNTGRQVRDVQRRVRHSAVPWMAREQKCLVRFFEAIGHRPTLEPPSGPPIVRPLISTPFKDIQAQ
jgi:hypothetical protein